MEEDFTFSPVLWLPLRPHHYQNFYRGGFSVHRDFSDFGVL